MSEEKDSKSVNHLEKTATTAWCGRKLKGLSHHPWASSRGWKTCSQCLYNRFGKGHVSKRRK
jgi:hypothetical protein